MFKNLSIRSKIIVLSVSVFILLMGSSTIINTNIFLDIVLDRIVSIEAPSSVKYVAELFEKKMSKAIAFSKIIGDNPFVYQWLEEERSKQGTAVITEYAQKFIQEGVNTTFIVSARTLDLYSQDGFLKTLSRDVARDSWFFDAVSSGKKIDINIEPSETNNELTAYVNVIIGDVNKPLGVAGTGISLVEVSRELAAFKVSESSVAYLITGKGGIKAHPDKRYITDIKNIKNIPEPNYRKNVVDELLRSDSGFLGYEDSNGEEMLVAFSVVPSTGWKIVLEAPKKELTQGLNKIIVINFVILAGCVLLVALILHFMMRVILKPITETVATLEDISEGEGDLTKRIEVNSGDESGLLSLSFNKFVDKLQGMIREIAGDVAYVSKSSDELADIATTFVQNSGETSENSQKAATASEEMSSKIGGIAATLQTASENISQVAAATEQMRATVTEIASRSAAAREITREAVTLGGSSSEQIEALARIFHKRSKNGWQCFFCNKKALPQTPIPLESLSKTTFTALKAHHPLSPHFVSTRRDSAPVHTIQERGEPQPEQRELDMDNCCLKELVSFWYCV